MDKQETLTSKILDYIQGRANEKLEALDKSITKLAASNKEADQQKLEAAQEKMRNEQEKHQPRNWLTDAATRANQIQFVSHAIKYIHGDAKGTNIFYDANTEPLAAPLGIVASHSINKLTLDVVGNAAALAIGKLLLQVEHKGRTLVDDIRENNISNLLPIAENEQQAQHWLNGFKSVFSPKELSSHKLAKQVYWPMPESEPEHSDSNNNYRLLSPLFATSFADQMYQYRRKLRDIQFSKSDTLKANGYSFIPHLAVQTFGGTKPQNISQLNSQRGGKNFLLDNRPPQNWQSIEKPILHTNSVFDAAFSRIAYGQVKSLQTFLDKVFEENSTVTIRDYRAARVDDIVEALIQFGAQQHQFEAGWTMSSDCTLTLAEKLWLDPKRVTIDDDFRYEMEKKYWHEAIAEAFAHWFNHALENKKLALGQVEFAQWKGQVAQELRLTERLRKEYYS